MPGFGFGGVRFAVVLCVVGLVSACTIGDPHSASPGVSALSSVSSSPLSSNAPEVLGDSPLGALRGAVASLEREGHAVGFVIVAGEGAAQFGGLRGGSAWSTAKVPLATAALRADQSAETLLRVDAAIRASDNAAAEELWQGLGSSDEAAKMVADVIHGAGDSRTKVPIEQLQPGFSIVGQTQWGLAEQARFLAGWRCQPEAGRVLDAMRGVVSDQRWGLGDIDGVALKGGWGPDSDGRYLVRQMALVPWGDGEAAVAFAVLPADGEFLTGRNVLDSLGRDVGVLLESDPADLGWRPLAACTP